MQLNYRKYGSGEPLLILHGLFGSSDNWQTLGKKFSEDFQVYLIDLRNHGHSPHSIDFSYELMANDINELILSEKLEKVNLLGHSMGGKVAIRLVQLFPFHIEKLIVADIGVKKYPMHHEHIIAGLQSINLKETKSRSEARKVLTNYVKEEGVQQFLLKNLYWKEKGLLCWRMNLDVLVEQMPEILKEMPKEISLTPTLFLRGEKSKYILEEDFDLLHEIFPNSEIETVYNAGHWLHAENPLDFYELVTDFIA
tara:strand:+ start:530 stop:1288 length:759 start_codon:yes stop_codon:yes gene_type:complete